MPAREYELQALQIERRRNEELERKLAEEVHRREELIEEQIRLRDRRKLQVCDLAMFTKFEVHVDKLFCPLQIVLYVSTHMRIW